jgi:hypothetical protein
LHSGFNLTQHFIILGLFQEKQWAGRSLKTKRAKINKFLQKRTQVFQNVDLHAVASTTERKVVLC